MDVESFVKECTNDAWNPEKAKKRYYKQMNKCRMGEKFHEQSVFSFDWFVFISKGLLFDGNPWFLKAFQMNIMTNL